MVAEQPNAEKQSTLIRPEIKTDLERVKEARLQCELVSEELVDLSHEKAESVLSLKTFKAEREVTDGHVQELYDEMAAGRFRSEHVNLAICLLDNETYRINGQHTCWARLFMPKNYKCQVRQLTYRVKSQEELKKLYGVFDPSYAARSSSHLIKMMLADTAAAGSNSISVVGHLATGFKFWKWGENRSLLRRQGHNEVSLAIQQIPELFQKVGEFYSQFQRTPHIKSRQAVIGAMFECWDRRPTFAEDFWRPVCDGLNLTDNLDPRYVLMRWLQERNVDTANSKSKKKSTSAEEMYRTCINTWNRWRSGEKVQAVRTTTRRFRAS